MRARTRSQEKSHSMPPNPLPSPLHFPDTHPKLDVESCKALVDIINHHMHSILDDTEDQKELRRKCTARLRIQPQESFQFPEHSVLSNLHWGIDGTVAANQAECGDERRIRLENSERMLQIPAALDENSVTLGIQNSYLVCCSYFYLSVVELIRENEWQVAVHFLQAMAISPRLVCNELAPGIFRRLWPLLVRHSAERSFGSRRAKSGSLGELGDGKIDGLMRWMAQRYKPWLMYYQIMSSCSNPFEGSQGDGTCSDDGLWWHSLHRIQRSRSIDSQNAGECRTRLRAHQNELMQPEKTRRSSPKKCGLNVAEEDPTSTGLPIPHVDESCTKDSKGSSSIKCLKDILSESEPDSPASLHSCGSSSAEEASSDQNYSDDTITSLRSERINEEDNQGEALNQCNSFSWISQAPCLKSEPETPSCDTDVSAQALKKNFQFTKLLQQRSTRMTKSYSCRAPLPEVNEENFLIEQSGLLEKIISKLCFTEELGSIDEDCTVEIKTIYQILNSKAGLKYSLLKDIILDQLLTAISTSNEERVVRISVGILSTIVTSNRSVVEDIKRKGLQLYDLAIALKRNVHEAVILIYLINPSPAEIKTLELLPCLVDVVCTSKSYKLEFTSLLLTPPAASLMIIEVLVTAFDYETNSMHLAAISSPRVLAGLLQVPRKDKLDEFVSLAAILVKCMKFDAKCRKYISEFSPLASFVSLLWSNQRRATSIALEFFNELHRMPRSSCIGLLEQIQKQGSINNMCALFLLTQNSEPEYKLLAANLLLQLEVLDDASAKCIYKEEVAEAILESLTCEESPAAQTLSASILANLGGTYSWTGDPYTVGWLVKKTGLASSSHKNLIKNYDFLDQCLQDGGIDSWCGKIAQRLLHLGTPVFRALDKGLNSKLKRVARDCLVATAWLGCELVKGPDELRHAAGEIILQTVEQYVHPGFDIEERLLACLCIYNYTSGRGMKKIINLSEGVRESLRRLSNVTWMAEELLKVADYFEPDKWRISCAHNQMLEAGNKSNGAVTALSFYKGQLYSGHADGSIKVWDIKGQTAALVRETKEHKKAVTCFALYEPGNCLLSGSADKTIKMWQMIERNVECIEVIPMKESIRSVDSCGELIFVVTQSHKLKMIDLSRKTKDVFKGKRVKCMRVAHGKVYAGCTDSSIQELMITNNRHQEIKAPSKSWMQSKPTNSVALYKDWLYSASSVVEGSKTKDWRRGNKPQLSISPEKGASVLAMEVVEDFLYVNCSTSMNSLQIWLRGTQHKVGRLSAGSKITSLLTANDVVLCGTEKGIIKGWIPL